jgi:hypothetical protein
MCRMIFPQIPNGEMMSCEVVSVHRARKNTIPLRERLIGVFTHPGSIGSLQAGGWTWVPTTYETQLREGNWNWVTKSQRWHGIGGAVGAGRPQMI